MPDEKPIVIKKYANRRLYDGETSRYVTFYDITQMARAGTEFRVVDAKTGDDITQTILTHIVMDEEARGEQMLPLSFLRELLSLYGQPLQSMIPLYLDATMNTFTANQQKFFGTWSEAGEFTEHAERNTAALRLPKASSGRSEVSSASSPEPTNEKSFGEDLASLQARLTAMQQTLDALRLRPRPAD
jgi:polyhydroxyalkanoate synthesis repressor PhaR